jgi:hypothetical protein
MQVLCKIILIFGVLAPLSTIICFAVKASSQQQYEATLLM